MKRCILHLGMPKTASTSMQALLLHNRELLKQKGWEYPVFTCPQKGQDFLNHNDALCRLFFESHLFHVHRNVLSGAIDLAVQKKGLTEQLDRYCLNSEKLVFSSEALMQPRALKRIKKYMSDRGFVVEPIVYIRSPYSYRVSLYQSFLRFSQFPEEVIVKRMQVALVRRAVLIPKDAFGDAVTFYPFNSLVRSGVDVVRHFLAHFLSPEECEALAATRDNESLSRHAATLLAYIESKQPLYVDDVKSKTRIDGDIIPLHRVEGEKFRFDAGQVEICRKIVNDENNWLRKNLGPEFCDGDYMKEIADEPLVWGEENLGSLLQALPETPRNIRRLTYRYLREEATFASPGLRKKVIRSIYEDLNKHRQASAWYQFMRLFPVESLRGELVRNLLGTLGISS